MTAATITGTTVGATNDFSPSCSSTSTAPEIVHELNFPGDLQSLTVTTDGSAYDTVVYIRGAECTAADFDCDDDGGAGLQSLMALTDVPAGLYFIFVDGFSANSGAYTLGVSGVIKAGEASTPPRPS